MLSIRSLAFAIPGRTILHDIDLEIARGEIVALIGPSGSGKSTLLRLIAGLERPSSGDILLDGESLAGVPPHARNIGLMFQDYALFPHLNVTQNILFGLKMHGLPRADRHKRLDELLALVNLRGFERRRVTHLSGGEQQRVALARSLAPQPRLLMLDEPLGALDAALRQRLLGDLKAILRSLQLTTLYVTHDQAEAFDIADRIAVINAGRIEQIGTPEAIYRHPRTVFIARFLGFTNILPVERVDHGLAITPLGDYAVEGKPTALLLTPGSLSLADQSADRVLEVRVADRVFTGESYRLRLQHASGMTLEVSAPAQNGRQELTPGTTLGLKIDEQQIVALEG
ncbi:MAG: ABC transporter ATP-binding protein [Anaerolineae bacterium]|nr:ABC transporter ATP-binding protein [Anaerolineae bacterium]